MFQEIMLPPPPPANQDSPSASARYENLLCFCTRCQKRKEQQQAKNKILMLKVLKELSGKSNAIQAFGDDLETFRHHRRSTLGSVENSYSPRERGISDCPKEENVDPEACASQQFTPQYRPKFIILHTSPFKTGWDWITLVLVLYTAVFTPFMAAFPINKKQEIIQVSNGTVFAFTNDTTLIPLRENLTSASSNISWISRSEVDEGTDWLTAVEVFVDIMFMADILINFRTTYVYNGDIVRNPKKIALNYMKGWFIIDAVAAIPFDRLIFGPGGGETVTQGLTGILKTARLLRLLRVARRIDQYSEYGAAVLILLMATFTLIAHWLACLFYAITTFERSQIVHVPISWLDWLAEKQSSAAYTPNGSIPDIKSRYITALYFTFTILTSVGFGNVAPNTNYEKVFTIFVMLLGSLMSAAIFGNVSSIMLRLYRGTEEYHEKVTSIKEFVKFYYIPKPLANRLVESYQQTRSYANGVDMNCVLKSFPDVLQADICLHLNRNLLSTCVAFKHASPGCLRALSVKFKSIHAPPGDTLIHPGDLLDSIFFVSRGSIEVAKEETVMAILGKDDIFGEDVKKSYFDENRTPSKSSYTVRAMSYSDMHMITIDDLQCIMDSYPDFAGEFLQNFGVTFNIRQELCTTPTKKDAEMMQFIRLRRRKSYYPEQTAANAHHNKPKNLANGFQTVAQIKQAIRRDQQSSTYGPNSSLDISGDEELSSSIVELSPEAANIGNVSDNYFRQLNIKRASKTCPVTVQLTPDDAPLTANEQKTWQSYSRIKKVNNLRPRTLQPNPPVTGVVTDENGNTSEPEETVPTAPSHGRLSPIVSGSSSMTCAPKSSPSTGALSCPSPFDSDSKFLSDRTTMKYLSDIDTRLKAINKRMGTFENDLCTTIDSILNVLGYEPKVVREGIINSSDVDLLQSSPPIDACGSISLFTSACPTEGDPLIMLP